MTQRSPVFPSDHARPCHAGQLERVGENGSYERREGATVFKVLESRPKGAVANGSFPVKEAGRRRSVKGDAGKGGEGPSAVKKYSQLVRLANLKSVLAGREREREAVDAEARVLRAEMVDGKSLSHERRSRSRGNAIERISGTLSESTTLQGKGKPEVSEVAHLKKCASSRPLVVRIDGKNLHPAACARLHNVAAAYSDVEPREESMSPLAMDVSLSGKSSGFCDERSERGSREGTGAFGNEPEGKASVSFNRNPMWPVADERQALTNKVTEVRSEQHPSPSLPFWPHTCEERDGMELIAPGEGWGTYPPKVAQHLFWDFVGDASPKSVLDRAVSSPVSTEEDSNEQRLSVADLKCLRDMVGPADVDESLSSANSAESLEFSSLAFMGVAEAVEPDLEYVQQILVTSRFACNDDMPVWHSECLAVSPTLFERLETGFAACDKERRAAVGGEGANREDQKSRQEERRQRMLLFDAVNEALTRRLSPYRELPAWQKRPKVSVRRRPSGRELLREVWDEIHDWPAPNVEGVFDFLDDAARRDMIKGLYKWDDFGAEESEVVLALEEMIFEGLVEGVVNEFAEIESEKRMRRAVGVRK